MSPRRSLILACAGLTATGFFWALNAVIGRGTAGEIPPVALAFWRWVLAFLLLAPFGIPAVARQWAVARAHWRSLIVLATFSVGLFNTLLYIAAQTTSALNIALINSSLPISVGLVAHFVLQERLTPPRAAGIALGFFGILIIITEANPSRLLALNFVPGDLIMLAAVASWTTFSIVLRKAAVPLSALAFLTLQIGLGIPVITPFFLVESLLGGLHLPRVDNLWIYLIVALGPSLLAYQFWNNGVRRIGASRAALFLYLVPIFATVLGYFFLDERLALFHAAGGSLIFLGLLLATRAR